MKTGNKILIIGFIMALATAAILFEKMNRKTKIACVGNSITYGHGIENRDSNSYPAKLQYVLGEDYRVENFGHSGATMVKKGDLPYWEVPEYAAALHFNPDIVIIKLGTNDSKPFNWDEHKDEFLQDYREMIKSFQQLKSKPLVYIGIPVEVVFESWGITPEVVQGEITPMLRNLAKEMNVPVIEFYDAIKEHPEYMPDGVHPDERGAALMAEKVVEALVLEKKE